MSMPYLPINDHTRLYYEEHGVGKPIVFIHPSGMGCITFLNQLPLANEFRLILYDMRGNGRSSPSDVQITMKVLANDLKNLLDFLNIERAIICGYSNGGSVALEFSLAYPKRVEKLILIGGFSEVCTPLLLGEYLCGIYAVKNHWIPLLAKAIGFSHGKDLSEKQTIERYFRKANEKDLYEMYTTGLEYSCTNRLSELEIPLLLLYGAKDDYILYHQQIFQKHVPHATTIYISKAKHQIPTKHYRELNSIIKAYC